MLGRSLLISTEGVSYFLIYRFYILFSYRIRAVPLFPGLRRFPEGRGYKQWTGDDSKALMKVSLMFYPSSPAYNSSGLPSRNRKSCPRTDGQGHRVIS